LFEELRQRQIAVPVLHGWTGTAAKTREAVALGCTFSIHSAVACESKFRTAVPPERILVETDHGRADPPAAIPCRIEWVEHLLAQQLGSSVGEVRRLVWENLARIIRDTGTERLLPPSPGTLLRAGSDGQERSGRDGRRDPSGRAGVG
jgi:Tat protein secretion system quality control protein TatD with DNase activity